MSNSRYGAVPAAHVGIAASFVNADGTTAKILLEPNAAAAPGATAPLFYGGASVYDLTGYSNDTTDRDLQLYRGDVLTTVGGSTGAATTTTNTIGRATGSFITDGWRVGKLAMIFAAASAAPQSAVEGILCTVSAVTAGTLTFSGTPIGAVTLDAGARVVAVTPLYAHTIKAASGSAGASAETWILSLTNSAAARVKDIKLGASQVLAAAPLVAVTAAKVVAVSGDAAKY